MCTATIDRVEFFFLGSACCCVRLYEDLIISYRINCNTINLINFTVRFRRNERLLLSRSDHQFLYLSSDLKYVRPIHSSSFNVM